MAPDGTLISSPPVFSTDAWDHLVAWEVGPAGANHPRDGIEYPASWSPMAVDIAVDMYVVKRGPKKESSIKSWLHRIASTIAQQGWERGYFETSTEAEQFYCWLAEMMVLQRGTFNSPVHFNVGVDAKPQGSACFISGRFNKPDGDSIAAIMAAATDAATIYKNGSGFGIDYSGLRGKDEPLTHGGKSSGPLSFFRMIDGVGASIKSGGKTRRAAAMATIDAEHPDVMDFIRVKAKAQQTISAMVRGGMSADFTNPEGAPMNAPFQNTNISIRCPDAFFKAVEEDGVWVTSWVTDPTQKQVHRARDILREISQAAWECGDPAIQYKSTISYWHTCKNTGPITSSNPCSEFVFLDDTACNLASLRLTSYWSQQTKEFDVELFRKDVETMITAQEIICAMASYPTAEIAENSRKFRPLGLGFGDLGSLLMQQAVRYGSEKATHIAATIACAMTGFAYAQSHRLTQRMGPCEGWHENKIAAQSVLNEHHAYAIEKMADAPAGYTALADAAVEAWEYLTCHAIDADHCTPLRNMQATLLAPMGTTGFVVGCGTTGIEPAPSLVQYKKTVGGAWLQLVDESFVDGLNHLGYEPSTIESIKNFVMVNGHAECPLIEDGHQPLFATALPTEGDFEALGYTPTEAESLYDHWDTHGNLEGVVPQEVIDAFGGQAPSRPSRLTLHWMDHLTMMAAVQPFLSGAISKTVNMPHTATVEDIENVYLRGWEMGLKAVAVYRDGSKGSAPISTSKVKNKSITVQHNILCYVCEEHDVSVATVQTGKCRTCPRCGTTTSCG